MIVDEINNHHQLSSAKIGKRQFSGLSILLTGCAWAQGCAHGLGSTQTYTHQLMFAQRPGTEKQTNRTTIRPNKFPDINSIFLLFNTLCKRNSYSDPSKLFKSATICSLFKENNFFLTHSSTLHEVDLILN
jgi:hypothetical protein